MKKSLSFVIKCFIRERQEWILLLTGQIPSEEKKTKAVIFSYIIEIEKSDLRDAEVFKYSYKTISQVLF